MLLAVSMCVTMVPDTGFAVSAAQEGENHAPVLKEGVSPTAEGQVKVKSAYLLTALQNGEIFTDPDGDRLTDQSYYYERSADGGVTWSSRQSFPEAMYGSTTIHLTENEPGVYKYRFYAYDGKDYSEDTWELTLNVIEKGVWATSFHVAQDQNYETNGNRYPEIKLYYTAGIDSETGHDYVGWYEKNGEEEYVYNPADDTIKGSEEAGWEILVDGAYYDLNDYHPLDFTDSNFGKETDKEAAESGSIVDNWEMFYANVDTRIKERISYRGYGYADAEEKEPSVYLGGMTLSIPTGQSVDGSSGGGVNVFLSTVALSAVTSDNKGFAADQFTADVSCPLMNCHPQSGDPFTDGQGASYPFMLYAAENACLYTYQVVPEDDSYFQGYYGNQVVWIKYNYAGVKSITCKKAVTYGVEVPADSDFAMYYQWNNFNTTKWESEESKASGGKTEYRDNGATKIYSYRMGSQDHNWSWRLTDKNGAYVTKSGWVETTPSTDTKVKLDFTDGYTDKKTQDRSGLGSTVTDRDDADLFVNLDPSGFERVEKDESVRVRTYRLWEMINTDTANIMVEPDFHYQLLQGSLEKDLDESTVNGGNAVANWADIDPDGTAVLAVNYDALDVDGRETHSGLFPATNPIRTGVFIVSDSAEDEGTADAIVSYNKVKNFTSSRSAYWDYNYDTWYYSKEEEAPALDFTVRQGDSAVTSVEYAVVTTDDSLKSTLSSYKTLEADEEGTYHVDLNVFRDQKADNTPYSGGTVIIRMKDASGYSYRLVRVAEDRVIAVNVNENKNTTKLIDGEETKVASVINPGDKLHITFKGVFAGLNKVSGIFNPTGRGICYTLEDGTESSYTPGVQYGKMDGIEYVLTIPEDLAFDAHSATATYTMTNGHVKGSMYSAASPFSYLYDITDAGMGTNFYAVIVEYAMSHLADVELTVSRASTYDMQFDVTDEAGNDLDAAVTLKNEAAETVTGEQGIYRNLEYGTYSYEITCEGYRTVRGSIALDEATEQAEDGRVHQEIRMSRLAEGAWDGVTKTEPKTDEAGTYQISTGEELAWFGAQVNSGMSTLNAVLTADIDLGGNIWTPMGGTKGYKGTFDGQGHSITDLCVKMTGKKAGLFDYAVKPAKICNLAVDGKVSIEAPGSLGIAYAAGVVAQAVYAEIENVTNKAEVQVIAKSGSGMGTGGIVGSMTTGTIKNCTNEGKISSGAYVGGILGRAMSNVTIANCSNHGVVYGRSAKIGGIAGDGKLNISNSYNTAMVRSGMTEITTQTPVTGGIVGSFQSGSATNCYNAGKVVSKNGAGALFGSTGYTNVKASNLYYLEGTCDIAINGTNTNKIEATKMTADEMADTMFVVDLNDNSGETEALFGTGESWPMFIREGGQKLAMEAGDINGDGQIDKADADALYVIVKTKTIDDLTVIQLRIMDLNEDGKVDSKDVSLLYAYAAGKISSFH